VVPISLQVVLLVQATSLQLTATLFGLTVELTFRVLGETWGLHHQVAVTEVRNRFGVEYHKGL
jgi:hypothetical protein